MRKCTRLLLLPLLASLAGCEITKTENPLSPSVAGPIPGVGISAPKLLETAGGAPLPRGPRAGGGGRVRRGLPRGELRRRLLRLILP